MAPERGGQPRHDGLFARPVMGSQIGTREKGALLSVLALALMLWPILCGLLWLLNAADNQGTTDYSPDPSWEVRSEPVRRERCCRFWPSRSCSGQSFAVSYGS